MQNCRGGNRRACLFFWPCNVAVTNIADAHKSGIGHLDAHLGRTQTRVEYGTHVADAPGEYLVGICVQADLCCFADVNVGKIIFINVAENPDVGQVRDGERIGRALDPLRQLRS